jgi:FixJ family two-component response regulator
MNQNDDATRTTGRRALPVPTIGGDGFDAASAAANLVPLMSTGPSDVAAPIVHVVEDDESSRVASSRLLRTAGYAVKVYATGAEFLASPPAEAGCIVLDLQLPGASGLDLQERLTTADNPLPIVFLTGHGDVPRTVQAMKAGAVDFLTKPVDGPVLLDAVARAIARDAENRAVRARRLETRARYNRLTPREREVFAHVISGQLNKQVGFDLGISERTIKIHRRQVLEKMEADSIAGLVRMAADLGIAPAGRVR